MWLQPGAQYAQKPGLYGPSEQQQQQQGQEGQGQQGGSSKKQVDDLGLDMSKQGKRWFPFSDGPRNCVGQALAKMNMAATFAQLYSHYSFQLAEEVTAACAQGFVGVFWSVNICWVTHCALPGTSYVCLMSGSLTDAATFNLEAVESFDA